MSKSCSGLLQLAYFVMREAKALARSCIHAGSLETSPQTNVIRTIISCADQFIVLIFIADHYFIFLFSIII